jgi:hypothetical protein
MKLGNPDHRVNNFIVFVGHVIILTDGH